MNERSEPVKTSVPSVRRVSRLADEDLCCQAEVGSLGQGQPFFQPFNQGIAFLVRGGRDVDPATQAFGLSAGSVDGLEPAGRQRGQAEKKRSSAI